MGEGARRVALALAVIAVYAASLRGGFLNYDDDWLIENNPILQRPAGQALPAIWFDLSPPTRQALGAEYLPVRDTFMWLEVRVLGTRSHLLRAVSLLLFLGAALLLRAYLRRTVDEPLAELAAWLFALHPVHAESVAWLAGQKDLDALVLVAAALLLHARPVPERRGPSGPPANLHEAPPSVLPFLPVVDAPALALARSSFLPVVMLVLLASLAKSVAVVTPLLLLAHDWMVERRPRWAVIGAAAAVTAVALALHLVVGKTVGMMTAWPGGGRLVTAATMGPVWLRYLGLGFAPFSLSVRHEVAVVSSLSAWAAYLPLLALGALAAWAARRDQRLPAFAWIWFVVPLLPTSQVLAPLQNLMADRYLLFAVLGPCLLVAWVVLRLPARATVVGALLLGAALLTTSRARVFSDSVALWQDAVSAEPASVRAHYQLAMALRDRGRPADAEAELRRALGGDDVGRMAGNNLAALLASQGRLADAAAVLRQLVARFPDDPKALGNLAEITARLGEDVESRRLFEVLLRRFPDYAPGRRNYQRHFTSPARSDTPPPPSPPPAR
jgi:tetratricopeptide (TPR) repeat protein